MKPTDDITEIIASLKELSGAGVCYYDLKNFFQYYRYGVRSNQGHYCRLCEETRALPGGRTHCERSDREEAVALAQQYRVPFFFECHMGMRELVSRLMHSDMLIGILFIGQCRIEGEDMHRAIAQRAQQLGGDPEKFAALYDALPLLTHANLISVGKILQLFFDVQILNNTLLVPIETGEGEPLAHRIRKYIETNFWHYITPGKIAESFFVNASYASRIFSREYGITITEYLHRVRISRAKTLLTATSAPISSIAINSGFTNANYFTRVFRKNTGMNPGQYRKLHQSGK